MDVKKKTGCVSAQYVELADNGAQQRAVLDTLYFLQGRENLDHVCDCQFLEKMCFVVVVSLLVW